MHKISEAVYMIPGNDDMMPGCHMYLMGMPAQKDLKLIDAGTDVKVLLPGHNRVMNHVPDGYIKETPERWRFYLR